MSWYQERERERIVRARRSQQLQYRAGSAISVRDGVWWSVTSTTLVISGTPG